MPTADPILGAPAPNAAIPPMPELPEVETTRRGIAPYLAGIAVRAVDVRQRRLRWPVSRGLDRDLPGQTIESVGRRAKYLLLGTARGTAIVHLGMSGSIRILRAPGPPGPHDHVDITTETGAVLRFNDPRRFGSWHWTRRAPQFHPLLKDLGPEPLGDGFDGSHLHASARGRKLAIKNLIMNGHIVVGVGNIYASEALFRAGIHPGRSSGRISARRMNRLANAIREVLDAAIEQGGTTLRDFTGSDGQPGYFQQTLDVYGRAGEPCNGCGTPLRHAVIGQRATYYCPRCQH